MSSFCVIGTTEIAKGDSYGTRFVGDAYIDEISREIQETFPGIKGFNRRGQKLRDSASFFYTDLLQHRTLIRCTRDDYWTV